MNHTMCNHKPQQERKLTEKEIRRTEYIKSKIQSFADQGYRMTELTISQIRANVLGIALALIPAALFLVCWLLRNPFDLEMTRNLYKTTICVLASLLGIAIHEGIHGLCYGMMANDHFNSIEFGITKDFYTPYCVCKTPLSRMAYCFGSLMPCVILGIIPCIVSIFNGDFFLLEFGCFAIIFAGGDLLSSLKLISHKSTAKTKFCIDHPSEIGLIMLEK